MTENITSNTPNTANGSFNSHYFLWLSDIHYDPHYGSSRAYTNHYNPVSCGAPDGDDDAPPIGKHGCDSPQSLVRSTLERAVGATNERGGGDSDDSPSFILITGDCLRHGVDELYSNNDDEQSSYNSTAAHVTATAAEEAMKREGAAILRELTAIVQEYFPSTQIVFSIGNNDVVPDYYLNFKEASSNEANNDNAGTSAEKFASSESSTSTMEKSIGMIDLIYQALNADSNDDYFKNALQTSVLKSTDQHTFLKGGYYYRSFHNGNLLILSLNTVIYSPFYQSISDDKPPDNNNSNYNQPNNTDKTNEDDPRGQFTWLKIILSEARRNQSRVLIVGHISPSIGSFRHTQLWKTEYIHRYYDIVGQFDDVVMGQLFGHIHTDEFRLVDGAVRRRLNEIGGNGGGGIVSVDTPILLGPSVTPLHGNDPSFRIVTYGQIVSDNGSDIPQNTTISPNPDGHYRLFDYDSYRCDISNGNASWTKLYTFSEAYNDVIPDFLQKDGLSSATFHAIVQSMRQNNIAVRSGNEKRKIENESPTLKTFRNFVRSGADGNDATTGANSDCNYQCQQEWLCTLTSITRDGYDTCVLQSSLDNSITTRNHRNVLGIVAGLFLASVFSFVLVIRLVRRRRRRRDYEFTPSVHQGGDDGGIAIHVETRGGEGVS
ncbi:hypothetical protein ACHAXS_010703 [Conticribra weissflogii]